VTTRSRAVLATSAAAASRAARTSSLRGSSPSRLASDGFPAALRAEREWGVGPRGETKGSGRDPRHRVKRRDMMMRNRLHKGFSHAGVHVRAVTPLHKGASVS